jgi:hydroxymethylpyrimidine pyrophosphatase-like HAD family hydrolase
MITHEIPASQWHRKKASKGLFVTDFDGTLLRSDRTMAESDLGALRRLGDMGITRGIATGRSMYSFNKAVSRDLPVDFIIFSTGAGVIQYPSGRIIRKVSLEDHEVNRATEVLLSARLDFMIHRPIPDNHMFAYFASGMGNTDFETRISLYNPYAIPLEQGADGFGPATQLLAVLPPHQGKPILATLRQNLSGFNVIQTTSPLDGKSTWIEIFPANVSKSLTGEWLAMKLGIDPENVLSLGNDYNDIDLLEWSGTSFVVDNAPRELKLRFSPVASNDRCGVAEAIGRWLEEKSLSLI